MMCQQFNFVPASERAGELRAGPGLVKKIPRAEAEERAMHYLRRVKIPEQAGKDPRPAFRRSAAEPSALASSDERTKKTSKDSAHA
jgi:ABC-type histidine transport system ATPase subunit